MSVHYNLSTTSKKNVADTLKHFGWQKLHRTLTIQFKKVNTQSCLLLKTSLYSQHWLVWNLQNPVILMVLSLVWNEFGWKPGICCQCMDWKYNYILLLKMKHLKKKKKEKKKIKENKKFKKNNYLKKKKKIWIKKKQKKNV